MPSIPLYFEQNGEHFFRQLFLTCNKRTALLLHDAKVGNLLVHIISEQVEQKNQQNDDYQQNVRQQYTFLKH